MRHRTASGPENLGIRRRRSGFAARLMVAQALVLVAGALTTWVVASAVGPGLFREHLTRAGDTHTSAETSHIEEAFGSALLLSVAVALLASVAAALAVSWYFSRRVQRSIDTVTAAAAGIAAGQLDTRVPSPGLGAEFDTLADGYNALAAQLETVEVTRRRLLADLAHEMRTPLATVEAHLEAVEDGVRDLDATTLAVIRSSTGRLRRLAEDISAVSRAEEGKLQIHVGTSTRRRSRVPRWRQPATGTPVRESACARRSSRCRCGRTRNGSGRCSPISWTTPYGTPRQVARSV